MSRAVPTEEELIATLKHTRLPTVLVEGPKDVKFFRGIEEIIGSLNASFLDCWGRGVLLSIFKRRSELGNVNLCFVADRDMWIFTGVPPEYSDVIFTEGYSIENDAYQDSNIEQLLKSKEKPNHGILIGELCRWFAFQVEEFIALRPHRADPGLDFLIRKPGFTCHPDALVAHGFRDPDPALHQSIFCEYKRRLRGKLLFEVLVRFFHAKNRKPRHSYDSLIEIATVYGAQGIRITALVDAIKDKLGIKLPANGQN